MQMAFDQIYRNSNILTIVSFSPVARPIRDCRPSTVKGQTLQSEENLYFLTKYEETLPLKYKVKHELQCVITYHIPYVPIND